MKILQIIPYKKTIAIVVLLLSQLIVAQEVSSEVFSVNKDVTIELDAKYTNIVFETWNKDKVSVVCSIEGEKMDAKERKKIEEDWNLDVRGNSKLIEIKSNARGKGSAYHIKTPIEPVPPLEGLEFIGPMIENIVDPIMKSFEDFPIAEGMADCVSGLSFDYDAYKKDPEAYMKKWDKKIDETYNKNNCKKGKDIESLFGMPKNPFPRKLENIDFDEDAYQKNKKKYLAKLNKKYKSKVTTKEVDVWLEKLEKWEQKFESKMEAWGEKIEAKVEAWSEKFEEDFEEEFEKKAEAWAEKMEAWAEDFSEQFEKNEEEYIVESENNSSKKFTRSARKIVVKIPKGAKLKINARYGSVDMTTTKNQINAHVSYAPFKAKYIDKESSSVNASYATLHIENWLKGNLSLKYSENSVLKEVDYLNLNSSSSNVEIGNLKNEAIINGSFGNLSISQIGNSFQSLDIALENTDAVLKLPKTNFDFYYNGNKSKIEYPKLSGIKETKNGSITILKGYKGSKSNSKDIHISAKYSDVILK